ncbi:hypothetical protein C0993_004957 [Termitomyces sp. T159_Od127]|nr:hypothetical protein C0993_004957 [Termitomyces sp. T159_Od127]
MPSLAGLFGRKKQPATKQQHAETASAVSSSPTDYVSAERWLPSSANGGRSVGHEAGVYPSLAPASNTSKLRLPFARKKQRQQPAPASAAAAAAASTVSFVSVGQDSAFSTPPRPSYVRTPRSSTSDSDADVRRLRPPPSKSAIFAAYADPHNALSTRSLPNESSPLASAPVAPKKPGFFHWSKSVPKTTPPASPPDSSFNLKSFRHVGPQASSLSPTGSTFSAPVPRPRGTSTDSSQRISVAAFREAQARRSTGGSPVPSLRVPSPGPQPLYAQARPAQGQTPQPQRRSSGLASDGDSTSPDDDEGEETIKGRGAGIARALIKTRGTKSEVGHGPREHAYAYGPRAQSSHILTSEYQYPVNSKDRSHSSLGFNVGTVRARASASTSAVTPSRDAKRASGLTATSTSFLPSYRQPTNIH